MTLDLSGFDKLAVRLHLARFNVFNEEKRNKKPLTNHPVIFLIKGS